MTDDLLARLRVFHEYDADKSSFILEAAARIEQLEEALIGIACDCDCDCYYNHVIAHCPHKQARAALEGKDD